MTEEFNAKENSHWVNYGNFAVYLDYSIENKLTIAVHEQRTSPDPATIKDCLFVEEIDLTEVKYHD